MIRVILTLTFFVPATFAAEPRANQIPLLITALNDPGLRQGASIALVKHGEAAVVPLQGALNSKSSDLRVWSAYTLGELGPKAKPAVADLCNALKARDAALRAATAEALGRVGDPESVTALVRALGDDDIAVRQNTATALGQLGSAAQTSASRLAAALGDENVRAQARAALVQIGPTTAEALTAALDNDRLRFDAALVLMHVAPEAAEKAGVSTPTDIDLPSLRAVFSDASRPTTEASAAASALATLGDDGLAVLVGSFGDPRVAPTAARAASSAGASAVPVLIEALKHERADVRSTSAVALAGIGASAKDAAPDLIRLLADEDRNVRYQAVRALHEFGKEAAPAVAALAKVVADSRESEPTRQWAIKTLVVTLPQTHNAVVKALVEGTKEETNYGVRQLARQMLLKIDPDAAAVAGVK